MTDAFRAGVARRLGDGRRSAKLTQVEVARHIGVSRQAVSGWERAESLPTVDELHQLGMLYGLSLDYLVYGLRDMPTALARLLDHREGEETKPPVL